MTQVSNQFSQSPEKGQLDLRMNTNVIPCQVHSSQATALVPGQPVKLYDEAGGVPKVVAAAADTDNIFGYVPYNIKDADFPAGAPVEIASDHSVMVLEASAAIARGAKVMPVISGHKVATATAGKSIVGIAIDKASGNGSLIRVFLLPLQGEAQQGEAAAVADLTEDGGALGGTNDGDLPDLTATAATVTGTLTGSVDGALADIADIALSTTDTYSDAAVNSAVNTAIASANLQLKELQTALNKVIADNVALRAAARENAAKHNELMAAMRSAGLLAV